jgi:hypothetical protein
MKSRLQSRLSALVGAGHPTPYLTSLASKEIEAVWDNLSADEVSELSGWLDDRQREATGGAQIEWTYIRATFTSALQLRGLPGRT